MVLGALALGAGPAQAAAPARLSAQKLHAPVRSSYGSGAFGRWGVDARGLPRYRYTLNEETSSIAPQAELGGVRDAWHQLGNDHVIAMAFNHGYTELWSQDHQYEWLNYAGGGHTAGGYGIVGAGGKTYSTLRDAAGGPIDFGVDYAGRHTVAGPVTVDERVYAPYGNDPLLLHDVRLRNTTRVAQTVSWTEVWDPNPYIPGLHLARPLAAPSFSGRTATVDQLPISADNTPDRIFAAALSAPVSDHDGFNLTNAVTLRPGASRTLRFAFGSAPAGDIDALVAHYAAARRPLAATLRAWQRVLPQANFGARYRWLARELQWDDYMVKSGESYEACAGHHIVSQGGYYQYGLGFQGAFRDPLQHVMPLIYTDPEVTRETLLFSAQEQNPLVPQIPYALLPGCTRFDLGTSDDLDLWLMETAAEYGLATRDTAFFDKQVPYADGSSGTLWEHLARGFAHQESQHGPHGEYISGATGDWSDLITPLEQMTESDLVVAQAAYVYPRLAELADLRGDTGFAADLRAAADKDKATLANEWVPDGWYARGYAALTQLGQGVIYGEPQPWAILAGVPDAEESARLVANIRRFLTGIGAPGGPSRIGSSQSPAANDPDVHEVAT
ncbi:MAG: cellobiose phosphorylase, partial [Solirubrobacteraceae bacterium]|nr:cellobiose phosphorylase [Solirubrobacteraceae bacterium]